MAVSKIFIENTLKAEIPVIDRKKHLIENQRVIPKRKNRSVKRGFPKQKTPPSHTLAIRTKRSSLLLLCSCFMIFFSLIPLLVQLNSFMWEKKRVLQRENDILYNLFLIERIEETQGLSGTDFVNQHTIPSFKLGTYKVKKGDSLFGISHRFNISIDSILTANNIKNAHYLNVGTVLRIPNMSGVFYTVKKGDSLSSIANKYGVKVNDIADINDLASSTIHIDQKLFIPGGSLSTWERASLMGNLFKRPTRGRVTSKMGFRIDPFTRKLAYHMGIDIANSIGTPIYAAQYGRVVYTGYKGNYGKTVIIVHPQGYKTLYAHLHKITVKRGEAIQQGEKIGLLGNTGRSTGPHLHFEVHQHGKILDPLKVIKIK